MGSRAYKSRASFLYFQSVVNSTIGTSSIYIIYELEIQQLDVLTLKKNG